MRESARLQRLFGGEPQASDRQPAPTGHQQVSGVYQKRETQNALREGATEELSRKRNQRC